MEGKNITCCMEMARAYSSVVFMNHNRSCKNYNPMKEIEALEKIVLLILEREKEVDPDLRQFIVENGWEHKLFQK